MKIEYAITTQESPYVTMVSTIVVPDGVDPTEHPAFFGKVVDVETIGFFL